MKILLITDIIYKDLRKKIPDFRRALYDIQFIEIIRRKLFTAYLKFCY